ncbi:histidinol-phosphate transaminase [Haliovirga abyssi]|uniref:Histidinol-phosphate aminotransferase n=1 Tax=Haliovirga abyssi TaxID=2996794 RepID=A0AAU9DFX3_9FUSO|nr:histidinol-phosphate transaminase [Haliovirga abyssi]BDU49559.1 histidinol-phosphate aminotransferase [Haliovirga abyssi]
MFDKIAKQNILNVGAYVPGKPIEDVKREYGLERVIKLASNENPIGVSPKAVEAMKKYIENLNLYPDGYAYKLREKLSKKLEVNMENLIFGDGTDEVIEMLFLAFVNIGDEVIYGWPSFVEYKRYAGIAGAVSKEIDLTDDYKFDLDEISKSVTEKTKMIFICNPNNPTGTIVKKEDVEKFIKTVRKDVLIIFDEAYFEYAKDDKNYPNSLDYQKMGYRNVITLRTFSKAYGMAGIRIGYGVADKEIIDILERVRLPFNVSVIAQAGAEGAIDDDKHIDDSIRINEAGKKYLYKEFERLGIKFVKTYSNFIYFEMKNAKKIFEEMMKKGVIVRQMGNNNIRVSIGLPDENEQFIKILEGVMKK